MSTTSKLTAARKNTMADALAASLNSGYLRIYNGTEPATADTALSGNTLLAELRFNATAAPSAVAGLLTFNAITQDSSNDANGTATFFRAFRSNGTTVEFQGAVGATGTALVMSSTTITAGGTTAVSSLTYQVQ
jgi:hypothetical protein